MIRKKQSCLKRIMVLALAVWMLFSLLPMNAFSIKASAATVSSVNFSLFLDTTSSNSVTNVTLSKGQTKYYKNTTKTFGSTTVKLLTTGSASNWNLKLEYANTTNAVPVMTLNGVDINSWFGICFGKVKQTSVTKETSDLKVVIAGDSKVQNGYDKGGSSYYQVPAMGLATTGTVTIESKNNAKLSLISENQSAACMKGALEAYGNLILNNANIDIQGSATWGDCSYGMITTGNVTVNGGELAIRQTKDLQCSIKCANFEAKNYANVKIWAAGSDYTGGDFTCIQANTIKINCANVSIGAYDRAFSVNPVITNCRSAQGSSQNPSWSGTPGELTFRPDSGTAGSYLTWKMFKAVAGEILEESDSTETVDPTKKPFYVVNQGGYLKQSVNMDHYDPLYPYFYDMPKLYAPDVAAGAEEGVVLYENDNNIARIAQALKEKFDAQPEGTRYIEYGLPAIAVKTQVEHVIYHTRAEKMMRDWLEEFLAEYKRIGGQLDGVIIDVEYISSHHWYLQDHYRKYDGAAGKYVYVNQYLYADIVNDPRYATEVRPLLEELGFEFYANPSGEKSEIWTIFPGDKTTYSSISSTVWNHVMDYLERKTYREGVLDVLLKYYPEAGMSDYQSGAHVTWEKSRDVSGGPLPFNLISAGNAANVNIYSGRNWGATTNMNGYNKAIHEQSAFAVTQNDVNLFKEVYNSTPDGRIDAWLGNYEYGVAKVDGEIVNADGTPTYSGTPYYSEVMFHVAMLNPDVFLGFLIPSKFVDRDGFTREESYKTTSDVLVELNKVAGFSDRRALESKPNWNGDYILSGMYAGGRNIWRITPDTTKVSVEDFKVNDTAPTFRIGNVTIVFPQGRIIEDGEVSRAGTCGYWVETPEGVEPVVIADSDRYQKNPSLWVDFEDYTVGASFTSSVGLPASCWTVSGTATIENGTNGKALALSSNSTVKCVTLPKLITAGDAYAMEQGWEITVTLPANYSGSVQLLKTGSNDNGFKISGSKLYYDQSGSYQELSGVTLSAGTYTLRRQINFNTFTCNYAIFNSNGTLLAEVKNVKLKSFTLPVAEVILYNVGSGKVVVDDLKMYPMGTTTILETYETEWGKKLDTSVARTEETAYRMSWMNATNDYKVAYIYDTTTGNVIHTVQMAPGMDGYVAEVYDPNGKATKFAVKVENATAPTTPDYNAGDFDWKPNRIPGEPIPTELQILSQPASVAVSSGATAKVTVKAAGDGLTYQWYYTDNASDKTFSKSSTTTAAYSTQMTSARNGRKVYCVITDKYGNSVTTKTVTLDMKITILTQPVSVVVENGATAKTSVTATGDGLKYTWYYTTNGSSSTFAKSSVTSATYSTQMTSARSGRQIYCVITDKYGNTAKTDTVTLGTKLAITSQPVSVVVENGAVAKATVKAVGEGLTYKWYFTENASDKSYARSSITSASYSMQMTSAKSGRKIYCVITDKYGNTITTNTVTLNMKVAITTQPVSVAVANGATAKVTVTAVGEGLSYQWYYTDNASDTTFSKSSTTTATYSAQMNEARDGRKVYCVITDKYGNKVTTNTVTLGMNILITAQPVSVTVANGATAKVTVKAIGEGLTYKWYYTDNASDKTFAKSSTTTATYSTQMNSARNGRKVYCVITDKYGNTVTSNTVTLKMK